MLRSRALFLVATGAANFASTVLLAQTHSHDGEDARASQHGGTMLGVIGEPRARWGSGTSWMPDSSPMYALMGKLGDGGWMVHENVFAGYDWFGGPRGNDQLVGLGSVMVMAWHPLGPGELMGRIMLSPEPATVGTRGYPLILQSGETANGEPLHDRQHPHDLFMEVAASYTLRLSSALAFQLYLAPVGEPALGPTAFPHRSSAASDPLAPLGHHWQDSTHIAFGVVTAAAFTRQVKVDASWFNGREPDEERYDFDLRRPDSHAVRLTLAPSADWSLQTSYGYLASPELHEPEVEIRRITASASYGLRSGSEGSWSSTAVFGENFPSPGEPTTSVLLESTWSVDAHHTLFGRVEYVRKTGGDLSLSRPLEGRHFDVGMLGLGYALYVGPFGSFSPGVGARGSLGYVEPALEQIYGERLQLGWIVYAQLRPAAMAH